MYLVLYTQQLCPPGESSWPTVAGRVGYGPLCAFPWAALRSHRLPIGESAFPDGAIRGRSGGDMPLWRRRSVTDRPPGVAAPTARWNGEKGQTRNASSWDIYCDFSKSDPQGHSNPIFAMEYVTAFPRLFSVLPVEVAWSQALLHTVAIVRNLVERLRKTGNTVTYSIAKMGFEWPWGSLLEKSQYKRGAGPEHGRWCLILYLCRVDEWSGKTVLANGLRWLGYFLLGLLVWLRYDFGTSPGYFGIWLLYTVFSWIAVINWL